MAGFDATASTFRHHRQLPEDVARGIRLAALNAVATPRGARILDLGAGAGRIGGVFVEEGDAYIGVDASLAMLREFGAQGSANRGVPALVQARGECLPFEHATFDVVLPMQVLSGAPDRRRLLTEARRVLKNGGAVIVGQTVADPAGMEAQLKNRLAEALSGMGVEQRRHKESRDEALAWLGECAPRSRRAGVASWTQNRRDFLLRKPTGHRFRALPPAIQEAGLERVASWAASTFASLGTAVPELRFRTECVHVPGELRRSCRISAIPGRPLRWANNSSEAR